jgi:erythromycin esterase-like protein
MPTTIDTHTFTHPLTGSRADYDPLLDLVGDAHFVLIGEASHGTHEFYRERAAITRRHITEKGFNAVAVEANWPDAYRANAFVRGHSSARDAEAALSGFERFPTWMWRNTVILGFIEWLAHHNGARVRGQPACGFYGLDLYSLYGSIGSVIDYLDRVDPEAAARARERYSCFDHTNSSESYGYAAALDVERSCEDEAVAQLVDLLGHMNEYANRDGRVAAEDAFVAAQNARVVQNAEEYYRSMFGNRVSTWNLRDQHMATTLAELAGFLERHDGYAKIAVWAHNSHVGDARATEMGRWGEFNIGQLAREAYGRDCRNIGFTTHSGTVTAARDWGLPAERRVVRPAIEGSYEFRFHDEGRDFLVLTGEAGGWLREPELERAIGVIYRPETERQSHYFMSDLPRQFDAVIHLDETTALEPLERTPRWETGEAPETYPFGQ